MEKREKPRNMPVSPSKSENNLRIPVFSIDDLEKYEYKVEFRNSWLIHYQVFDKKTGEYVRTIVGYFNR